MKHEITKIQIRKAILQYRKLLDRVEYMRRNDLLIEWVWRFILEHKPKVVHSFLAIEKNKEPNLRPLFSRIWEKHMDVIISRTNFQEKTMDHFYLREDTILAENHLSIPEPVGDLPPASIQAADVIFIPLLIADKKGNRVGYGGGFYDRLLSETKSLKVGLSLSPPVDQIRQSESWDVPLDYLITPYKTHNYG